MKKPGVFLILVFIIISCNILKESGKQKADTLFISEFLQQMIDEGGKNLMKYISPSYIKKNSIDISGYSVNIYTLAEYSIKDYDDGKVTANIWGEERGWVHELVFEVVIEDGKRYLNPSEHSDSYIHPWIKIRTYITN